MTGAGKLALRVTMLLLAGAAAGCAPEPTVELVAIRGCGTEQEFSGLRVRVVGDLPATAGTELLLGPGERGRIPELDQLDGATGVVAEGLFGNSVTAIGRSHGIDGELARGRVPGFASDAAVLPVYFAAPESACGVPGEPLSPRVAVAAAAGPAGDVLIAGGLGPGDAPLAELIHVDLFADRARLLADTLPSPRWGASVHAIGGRRFVVLGGARAGQVLAERVEVDVAGSGAVTLGPLTLAGEPLALAHHATALAPDGRVWVLGGCDQVDDGGACSATSALGRAVALELAGPAPIAEALPPLLVPRFGAHAHVSTDGVAFVAGGTGADGLALGSVERRLVGGAWTLVHELADGRAITGLAVLDGGLALLLDDQGGVHWWSEAGSGLLDPTSRAPDLDPFSGPRPLLPLPGERVLAEGWLFAPATAAIDPAVERVATSATGRSGAVPLLLGDGTALLIGGRVSASPGQLAEPSLLRLRPELDGPDEWIPELAGPATDAFVSSAPGLARVVVGGLQIDGQGPADAIAPVDAHVRGFRSGSLRLELEVDADAGGVPQIVLRQGAVAQVAIALTSAAITVRRRDPTGAVETLACSETQGVPGDVPIVVELDDQATRLRLSAGELRLECALAWPSEVGVSVGFGASGSGSARFYGLRLARR